MLKVALSSGACMDCIITFTIFFKILGTYTLILLANVFALMKIYFLIMKGKGVLS